LRAQSDAGSAAEEDAAAPRSLIQAVFTSATRQRAEFRRRQAALSTLTQGDARSDDEDDDSDHGGDSDDDEDSYAGKTRRASAEQAASITQLQVRSHGSGLGVGGLEGSEGLWAGRCEDLRAWGRREG